MALETQPHEMLCIATRQGNLEILKKCYRKHINTMDADGMTSVHWASMCGNLEALRILVRRGGNPEKVTTDGSTTAHLAACTGHLPCLMFLSNFGCNIYAVNDNGQTPLDLAVINGNLNCVRHLEALVSHQVQQDKGKVEKIQMSAHKDAERRIKEKNKMMEKLDRVLDRNVKKTRKYFHLRNGKKHNGDATASTSSEDNTPNGSTSGQIEIDLESQLSIADDERNISPRRNSESLASSSASEDSRNTFLNNSLDSSNSRLDVSKRNGMTRNKSGEAKLSRSASLLASLRSLHSANSLIPSGSYSNISFHSAPAAFSSGFIINPQTHGVVRHLNGLQPTPLFKAQPTPTKQMETLYTLLHSLQLDDFRELFRRENIDLDACLLCDENDLREIGLPVGPRKKVLDAIRKRNAVLGRKDLELVDSSV